MHSLFSNSKKIGIVFLRDDFQHPKVKELYSTLKIMLLEISIVERTIDNLLKKDFRSLDAIVGDCKCQVRASMILDICQSENFKIINFSKINNEINLFKVKVSSFILILDSNNLQKIKSVSQDVHKLTMHDFLEKNNLVNSIPYELLILSLCFFIYTQNQNLAFWNNYSITNRKLEKLLELSKKNLLSLSIDYEQKIAEQYGNIDEQKVIRVIESKGFCIMTSFFPSFLPIWKKIKFKKQLILKRTLFFCSCGSIKDIKSNFYRLNEDLKFEEVSPDESSEILFKIEGYKFDGSLEELKSALKITNFSEQQIKKDHFKLCTCQKALDIPKIENIEEVILASFAQHDQFTNKPEIDWQGLGLENSNLKKEYDRLKTIPGCSLDDMSIFRIIHIYASTVGQELEDQREFLAKLGKK